MAVHRESMINHKGNRNIVKLCFALMFILAGAFLLPFSNIHAQEEIPLPSQAEGDSLVIVLDPGHGGEEEGGLYENFIEKDMNLIVANAMKEELEKYEGVTVYLTRTGDQKLSLAERSAFAKSVNADFMFCLHFTLSIDHTLFGAECWVSAFGEAYSKGYSFADVEIKMLEEAGLYARGIKTRLQENGTDYYGIIRTAAELDVPCVLIEHCHMDHENDRSFCEGRKQWEAFGRLDATAAAKYFNLKSDTLGVDYTDYQNVEVPIPDYVVKPDTTPPDICMIELAAQDLSKGEVTIQVSAADYDSSMLYYSYSYDGGQTFSALQPWGDKSQDTITFTMQIPPHIVPEIVVNGYNNYDLYTQSNQLSLPAMDYKTEEEIAAQKEQESIMDSAIQEPGPSADEAPLPEEPALKKSVSVSRQTAVEENKPVSFEYFLSVCLVCALLVLGMALSMMLFMRSRRNRRRRRRKKR